MIKVLTFSDFCDEFSIMGRSTQFSHEAKRALFDWLEDFEDGDYELDVIEICCGWSEDSIAYACDKYSCTIDELRENTFVLDIDSDTILYQSDF